MSKDVPMQTVSTVVNRDLLARIQMEYLEMPGLHLTSQQARRLWNLDQSPAMKFSPRWLESSSCRRPPAADTSDAAAAR